MSETKTKWWMNAKLENLGAHLKACIPRRNANAADIEHRKPLESMVIPRNPTDKLAKVE